MEPFNIAQGQLPRPQPIRQTYDELLGGGQDMTVEDPASFTALQEASDKSDERIIQLQAKDEYVKAATDFLNQFEPQDTKFVDEDTQGRYTVTKKNFLNSHGSNYGDDASTPYPGQGTVERQLLDYVNDDIKDTKFHRTIEGFQNKHIEDVAAMLEDGDDFADPLEALGYDTDFERV